MKKLLLSVTFFVTCFCQAQEWKVEEKSVTGVFTSGKSKSDLFTAINKWISLNYNSAQNVIQMNEPESGTIIIKGINEVTYSNLPAKVLMPNNKYVSEKTSNKFNHTIEVNVKENRFRIIYTLTSIVSPTPGSEVLMQPFFDTIALEGDNSVAVEKYIGDSEKYLKQGLIGKQKRENWRIATLEMFKELNKTLLDNIKTTMLSIEKSTVSEEKW
ncbi:DUF4468 domain-containing protein [Flavobacterium granuli]|uniref:Uncharacterized protein with TBP-like fold DUF4468 n=1 Tax=Flavobacterium granuli TaxID=280093 RepID=A0A1M5U6A7_9FLAO|nr:DUF4468 domain-containing protein [Flavobacterium granuli]PRZ19569.1 uncharacterized protein with TBP-like fold DUF4468 [Flavobacterium granuli]SHH58494.1 protein of unknown function [Flavobacterium granuli]